MSILLISPHRKARKAAAQICICTQKSVLLHVCTHCLLLLPTLTQNFFPKLQTLALATRVDSGCWLWVAIPYSHSTWWRESRRQAVRARHSPRLRASEQPSGQHARRPIGPGELLCFLQFVGLDLVSWLIGESLVKWNENSLILSVN
jgi:hypothetical protein